jgi:hypothetical protein
MKIKISALIAFLLIFGCSNAQNLTQNVRISETGRSMEYANGKPFFWLGDTAWELFHRLKIEEIENYLDNRKEKGFNVIQCVVLAELDGVLVPNRYGHVPFLDNDPTRFNEHYFQLVDTVVKMAEKKGMYLAILPTWGDKVTLKYGGAGPVIFNEQNGFVYGELLGERFKGFNNIFWILGGDRPPADNDETWLSIYSAMAYGIDKGSGKKTLKSFHPGGFIWESSKMLQQEPWMDFNMIQSGHAKLDVPVWEFIKTDWHLKPSKPTMDAEPCYEDHPINPWNGWDPTKGYFRDWEVRRQIYRSVFAGGFGVTYGHHAIWQFFGPAYKAVNYPDRNWQAALDRPAAFQAGFLKDLILSRPSTNRIPAQALIKNQDTIENKNFMVAFTDNAKSYAMIYLPNNKSVKINMKEFPSKRIKYSWFRPETGKIVRSKNIKTKGDLEFQVPDTISKDWVLILDKIE